MQAAKAGNATGIRHTNRQALAGGKQAARLAGREAGRQVARAVEVAYTGNNITCNSSK